MSQPRTLLSYHGFKKGDVVRIQTGILIDNEIIERYERFTISSFPPKSHRNNVLVQRELYDDKEFTRKQFVLGKTPDGRIVRTYICNIKHAPL